MSLTHAPSHILSEKRRATAGAPPSTPQSIDGANLSAGQRTRLSTLIRLIWQADKLRSSDAIVRQAVAGFMRTVQRRGRAFDDLPYFRLGVDGTGPVVWVAAP